MKFIKTTPKVVTKAKTFYKMSQGEVEEAIRLWLVNAHPRTGKVMDVDFEVYHDGCIITPDDVNAIVTVEEE
jgi:hypothetical protein